MSALALRRRPFASAAEGGAGGLRLGTGAKAALGVVALLALVALLAPLIAPYDPDQQDLLDIHAGPSADHLLGTDQLGRDILSRLIWGARPSLAGPLAVVLTATAIGVPIALAAGWWGGVVDTAVGRALDLLFAFPGILLAVLAVAMFGSGIVPCVIALAIAFVPLIARVTRSAVLGVRGAPYIAAAEVVGVPTARIWLRHLLPNIAPIVIAQATVAFGYALIDLAVLSFLGFGVQGTTPDWGMMVNAQQSIVQGHPGQAVWAGVLIVVAVSAVSYLGTHLTDRHHRDGRDA